MANLHRNTVDGIKKQLVHAVFLQKVTEIAQCCFIRYRRHAWKEP